MQEGAVGMLSSSLSTPVQNTHVVSEIELTVHSAENECPNDRVLPKCEVDLLPLLHDSTSPRINTLVSKTFYGALALGRPTLRLSRCYFLFYRIAIWVTFCFWFYVIASQYEPHKLRNATPWPTICIIPETMNQCIEYSFHAFANIGCYWSARRGLWQLMASQSKQQLVQCFQAKSWRRFIIGLFLIIVGFCAFSVGYYTPTYVPKKLDGNTFADGINIAVRRSIYFLVAWLTNLINQSVKWTFVAVFAMAVELTKLRLAELCCNMQHNSDPSQLLDNYYEMHATFTSILREMRFSTVAHGSTGCRPFILFDFVSFYVSGVVILTVYRSAMLILQLWHLDFDGVVIYAELVNGTTPSYACYARPNSWKRLPDVIIDFSWAVGLVFVITRANALSKKIVMELPRAWYKSETAATSIALVTTAINAEPIEVTIYGMRLPWLRKLIYSMATLVVARFLVD